MPKRSAMIRARTTAQLKEHAEKILRALGMSPSDAINIFYTQVVLKNGLPFEINLETDDEASMYEKIEGKKELRTMLDLD